MPLTNVKLIEPVSTPCQKCEIVERLTDAMVSSRARTCSQ
jgi:phenylpyruvate tautomerase PptA (4-oxalocrotonate tautomerase family)